METLKMTTMSIGEIMRRKNKGLISPHHSLQRLPGQWGTADKGGYISDILQGLTIDPLKLGEEKLRAGKILWVLDGVQRITIAEDYINNVFAISNNVERYMIEYVVSVLDEDGVLMFDEDGKPVTEFKVFDIRKKKFKQLPVELQNEFLEYKFNVLLHPDCTSESISYHLKRYNAGKSMNMEQKGFTYIGDRWANVVRNIATMSFFGDAIGKYSSNDFKVGKINRVIAESLMTTKFLDNYNKNFAENCKYIEKYATSEDFEELRGLIGQLEENIDESVGKMFTSKDSFLWFGLYSKFVKAGLSDDQFNTFMLKLNKGMYTKDEDGKIIKDAAMTGICTIEIDGTTLEVLLKNPSTKDTNIVKTRIDFLTKLMCNYFNVDIPDDSDSSVDMSEEMSEFAEHFANKDIAIETLMLTTDNHSYNDFKAETLLEMIKWYKRHGNKTMLDNCLSYKTYTDETGIPDDNKNLPLYVYAVKYIFDNDVDIDIDEWLMQFKDSAFADIDNDPNNPFEANITVVLKQQEIVANINKFITERTKEDENV